MKTSKILPPFYYSLHLLFCKVPAVFNIFCCQYIILFPNWISFPIYPFAFWDPRFSSVQFRKRNWFKKIAKKSWSGPLILWFFDIQVSKKSFICSFAAFLKKVNIHIMSRKRRFFLRLWKSKSKLSVNWPPSRWFAATIRNGPSNSFWNQWSEKWHSSIVLKAHGYCVVLANFSWMHWLLGQVLWICFLC